MPGTFCKISKRQSAMKLTSAPKKEVPGTKCFSELKHSVGNVSQKVLTGQLRAMEESGLLTRTVYPEVLPRVESIPSLKRATASNPFWTPCRPGANNIRLKILENQKTFY